MQHSVDFDLGLSRLLMSLLEDNIHYLAYLRDQNHTSRYFGMNLEFSGLRTQNSKYPAEVGIGLKKKKETR